MERKLKFAQLADHKQNILQRTRTIHTDLLHQNAKSWKLNACSVNLGKNLQPKLRQNKVPIKFVPPGILLEHRSVK